MPEISLESLVTGKVWKVEKQVGDAVAEGESILIVESMKMEIPLEATSAGIVARLAVSEGDNVSEGQVLAVLSPT